MHMPVSSYDHTKGKDECVSLPSQRLTNVSQVDEAVLADVGTGARLWLHYGAGVRLFIANNSQLRRLHTAWQIYIKHRTQFL